MAANLFQTIHALDIAVGQCAICDYLESLSPAQVLSIVCELQKYRKAETANRVLLKRAIQLMYLSGGSPIENALNPIDPFLFDAECVELK
ncbi:hypothetical protein NUBL21980_16290 [Klebsiella michiganensis]|nr:hypothetical protein NUBL21980_16290 [Klebsiella michiganensis]